MWFSLLFCEVIHHIDRFGYAELSLSPWDAFSLAVVCLLCGVGFSSQYYFFSVFSLAVVCLLCGVGFSSQYYFLSVFSLAVVCLLCGAGFSSQYYFFSVFSLAVVCLLCGVGFSSQYYFLCLSLVSDVISPLSFLVLFTWVFSLFFMVSVGLTKLFCIHPSGVTKLFYFF